MRLTLIRPGVNIYRMFKSHWLMKRKRKLFQTEAEAVLLAKGIQIYDAKDVIRPAFDEEPYEPPPSLNEVVIPQQKTPCYIFTNHFIPIEKMEQSQVLTNSVVFDSLPPSILDKVEEPSQEDQEVMSEILLNSHLLDAQQRKLPYVLDVINQPGYRPPRRYGITLKKKISSFLYKLLLHIDQIHSNTEGKSILEDVSSSVTLTHSGKLMHLNHQDPLILFTKEPLQPLAGAVEVEEQRGSPMPDLYPLSPFIHCRSHTEYELIDRFALPGAVLAPHTLFVSCLKNVFLLDPPTFYAMTLLHAFSHAAAYARDLNKDLTGDLKEPVSLNVVHTNGQYFHIGRFQLNTLDCNGSTRNFFWHEPWTSMYESINFVNAKPNIEGVNARPLSLLRAIY